MIVKVEVKDEKVLKFFDILNALRDDLVINFNAEYEDDAKEVEYEDETNDSED
jgi:hypothetical protein